MIDVFCYLILFVILILSTLIVKRRDIVSKFIVINQITIHVCIFIVLFSCLNKDQNYLDIPFFYIILGPITGLCLMMYAKNKK